MIESHNCQVCGGGLQKVDAYSSLPRVTSDCKPWPAGGTMASCVDCGATQKIPDTAWLDDIRRIYDDYQIYQLSGGAEQVIFLDQGQVLPRSAALVSFYLREANLPETGRLLDVGCGNGAALANFSKALTKWSLFGKELSDRNIDGLRRIPNFVELFTGSTQTISGKFEAVSLIHSLEHMTEPLASLSENGSLLSAKGKIFVEVPDFEASPFDLLVADHLMHFTRATLAFLAARAGLMTTTLRNDVLPKELTMVAYRGETPPVRPDAATGASLLRRHLAWLNDVLAAAKGAVEPGRPFGIFGTSISSMWLHGALSKSATFFVDEDQSRVGSRIDGSPILSMADIPPGSTLYIPLIPSVAKRVMNKCKSRQSDCRYLVPADFSDF